MHIGWSGRLQDGIPASWPPSQPRLKPPASHVPAVHPDSPSPHTTPTHPQEGLQCRHGLVVGLHAVAVHQGGQAGTVKGKELVPIAGQAVGRVRRVPPRVGRPRLKHRLPRGATADGHQVAQGGACGGGVGDPMKAGRRGGLPLQEVHRRQQTVGQAALGTGAHHPVD